MVLKKFNYNTPFLNSTAMIAQVIFITCVGINLYFSYNSNVKDEKDKKILWKTITRHY